MDEKAQASCWSVASTALLVVGILAIVAYVLGGFGMTVTKRGNVVVVPIRSGVGARLGINVGYLNFTNQPTWNPF